LIRRQGISDKRLRAYITLQAAHGMEYLHLNYMVHFDLKCDNLLCDLRDLNKPVVKIGDLGLSKLKKGSFVSGNMRGTLPWWVVQEQPRGVGGEKEQCIPTYPPIHPNQTKPKPLPNRTINTPTRMAPELFPSVPAAVSGVHARTGEVEDRVTEKVDVFSFGICMWEIWTLGEQPYPNLSLQEIFAGVMTGTLRPSLPGGCDPAWASLMQVGLVGLVGGWVWVGVIKMAWRMSCQRAPQRQRNWAEPHAGLLARQPPPAPQLHGDHPPPRSHAAAVERRTRGGGRPRERRGQRRGGADGVGGRRGGGGGGRVASRRGEVAAFVLGGGGRGGAF